MKAAADGFPEVGRSSRKLGVRIDGPTPDIPVRSDRDVEPETGGMSVTLDSAANLPIARRPRSLGGFGRDPVFSLLAMALPLSLHCRTELYPHALVEPSISIPK